MNSIKTVRPRDTVGRWCQQFERRCRAAGVRVTSQRRAVFEALAADGSHPTAEALYVRLAPAMPGISRTTVYRVLDSLERKGLIRRVSSTGGVARFDARPDAHQHLVCRVCGAITDVSLPALRRLAVPRARLPRFVAEHVEVQVVGRCAACHARDAGGDPRAAT
jgi:Fur family peroxide stress response transcriptional regulator